MKYITSYYFVSDIYKHTLNLYAITCISNFIPVSLLHTNSLRLQFTYIYLCVHRIKKLNKTHHQKPLNLLASFTICILHKHKHNYNFSCGCAYDLQNKISPMRFTNIVLFFWPQPLMFLIKYLMTPIFIGFFKFLSSQLVYNKCSVK